ncbi:hypothetical protein [Bacillus sp. NPDC077027]|uniref:hypothetical protein n=1 Tax=Bacillus sp. NPDC077027 TaxID=3390548 RepID=UPI003D028264
MAKSKAKKKRDHLHRQQNRNPEQSRGIAPVFSTHTRTTKTKREALQRLANKHKDRNAYDHRMNDHKHFYFVFFTIYM